MGACHCGHGRTQLHSGMLALRRVGVGEVGGVEGLSGCLEPYAVWRSSMDHPRIKQLLSLGVHFTFSNRNPFPPPHPPLRLRADRHARRRRPDGFVPGGLFGRGPGGGERAALVVAERSGVRRVPGGEVRWGVVMSFV